MGKDVDRAAAVSRSGAEGRPRLKLTGEAAGNPRIGFLDDKGQVVQRLPRKN